MVHHIPARSSIYTKKLDLADLDKLVTEIRIVGSVVEPDNPKSIFHFRFCLVIEDGSSIRLDMAPNLYSLTPLIMRGIVAIESNPPPEPDGIKTISWSHRLERHIPAGTILVYILEKKTRDQYDFDENGQGCRTWCELVVKDLIELGILRPDAAASFNAWESAQVEELGFACIPMPKAVGRFY